jgi:hypothetical protein
MTTREFLNNVINGTMNEEMQETAKVYLANLDAKNEKRKTSPSNLQKKNESASRALKVITYLKDNAGTAFNRDEVALAVGVTPAQVTSAVSRYDGEGLKIEKKRVNKSVKTYYSF